MKTRIAFIALLTAIPLLAQEVYVYAGAGSAYDSSTNRKIETFGDGTLYSTEGIGGVFGDFGLGVQLRRSLGAAFDIGWRAPQGVYTGMHYRPTLYSFDAVFSPVSMRRKRSSVDFRLGIGGEKSVFDADEQGNCVNGPACANSNHFQVHFGIAPRFYLNNHFFLRPAVDAHYVNHFAEFGSDFVPRYTFSVGYSLGRE